MEGVGDCTADQARGLSSGSGSCAGRRMHDMERGFLFPRACNLSRPNMSLMLQSLQSQLFTVQFGYCLILFIGEASPVPSIYLLRHSLPDILPSPFFPPLEVSALAERSGAATLSAICTHGGPSATSVALPYLGCHRGLISHGAGICPWRVKKKEDQSLG